VAGQFVDGFGLKPALDGCRCQPSVSRRFQERAQQALEEFEDRSLEEENFLALWIDGKRVAGEQMIVCMGVTERGYKKVLGFTQATTERAEPVKELLRDLLETVLISNSVHIGKSRPNAVSARTATEHVPVSRRL
jgi:transposase-like protein